MTGRTVFAVIWAAAALALAGCANTAGVPEFRVYAEAIDALAEASLPIVDRVAEAERRNAVRDIDEGLGGSGVPAEVNGAVAGAPAQGLAPELKVAHAVYFAESGRPPYAAALDAALAALKRFNAAALIYAEGEALSAARGDLDLLTGNVSAAAGAAGLSLPAIGPATAAFLDGASAVGALGSREAFRTILREEGGRLDALLAALIETAPVAFRELTRAAFDARGEALILGSGDAAALTEAIKADRRLISEWILLMRTAREALGAALAAIEARPGAGATLSGAVAITTEANRRAERLRAALAASE